MKIIVLGTECWTFEKFRGSLLKKFVSNGHQVIAIGSDMNTESFYFLKKIGVSYYHVGFAEGRKDFFSFFLSLHKIYKIFSTFRPDVCLSFFLKPILTASILKIFIRFKQISLVEGLGHAFSSKHSFLFKLIMRKCLYFITFQSDNIFCLNYMDKDDIIKCSSKKFSNKFEILTGIGVDLDYYRFVKTLPDEFTFLFLSRLLKSKGLEEFIQAAILFKKKGSKAKFLVFGQPDFTLYGYSIEKLKELNKEGIIVYGGIIHDVRSVISNCSVLVLPTFYREGLPRCIQEAMSMGKPVITTKESGCSNIIVDKSNGFIIPSRNVDALVDKLEWFCSNPRDLNLLSINSRRTAELHFNCKNTDKIIYKVITDSFKKIS